ncbi:hypothetical protein JL720_13344 [Aureococcus anophagefferens]|nr:hypothetical protein JL720_13344 [Aureococcus anophagefferens]
MGVADGAKFDPAKRRDLRRAFDAAEANDAAAIVGDVIAVSEDNDLVLPREFGLLTKQAVFALESRRRPAPRCPRRREDRHGRRRARLADIGGSGTSEDQKKYKAVVDALAASSDVGGLQATLTHLLSDAVPQVVSRNVVAHFARAVAPPERLESICSWAVARSSRRSSRSRTRTTLRHALYDCYLAEGPKEAACTLGGIDVETCSKPYADLDKAALAEDRRDVPGGRRVRGAETYVNRASGLMHAVDGKVHWALQLRYRVTLARTLDARRKFLDASMRYYELSQARHEEVNQDDLLALLSKAVTCALLGNAGPQRSRIRLLYKDERVAPQMEQSDALARARAAGDGLTIPEKAMIQHNLAACRSPTPTRACEVGALLDIDPRRAEQVASRMIADGRLAAKLDQVDGAHFADDAPPRFYFDPSQIASRLRLDATAAIFVNYREEREDLVKTEAADLIERKRRRSMLYRASAGEFEIRTTSQIADEGGPATHQLVAATVIPDRSAPRRARDRHGTPADALRPAQLLIQFVVLPRKMGTAATRSRFQFDFVLMLCRPLGVKGVPLRDGAGPGLAHLGFEHVGSSASLIHLRFDLLFKRDRGVLARSARGPDRRSPSMDALKIFSDSAGLYPMLSEVQKARLRMKDQEHIRARRGSTRPDEGWEESDEDDPVEDLIHRERIRERDLLRTPGCLALGRKAFRLEDMPRVTERDREILRRVLYILREAERFCAGVRSARVAPSS